jgi:hypothetical protein
MRLADVGKALGGIAVVAVIGLGLSTRALRRRTRTG